MILNGVWPAGSYFPDQGSKPAPAVKVPSPNYWTTRELPFYLILFYFFDGLAKKPAHSGSQPTSTSHLTLGPGPESKDRTRGPEEAGEGGALWARSHCPPPSQALSQGWSRAVVKGREESVCWEAGPGLGSEHT